MKPYLIISINPAKNRVNGGLMYKITLQDLETAEKHITYIDPNNRNYQNWQTVIANRDQGQVIVNVRTTTKRGKVIVDADSMPQHVYCGNPDQLADIVESHWNTSANRFNDLFE